VNPELHFFYCGNGDTILLRAGEEWGLIDCNLTPGSRAKERLLKVLDDNAVKTLSFVCLTHYDRDHFNGLAALLRERFSEDLGDGSGRRRWFIGQIIQPLTPTDVQEFHKSLGVMKGIVERINGKKPPVAPAFAKQALESNAAHGAAFHWCATV
jgi:glyoxylase-like metal-dependent hydrolase (beta-lactamase superfamily II)